MPRKERPAPLSDSIFRAKLGQHAGKGLGGPRDAPEEAIPVHNTFIQFGAPEGIDGCEKKGLTTAPAWVGPSFQNVISSVVQSAVQEQELPPPEGSAGTETSEASSNIPDKLGSPKKVPVMRYSLSGSSARAVGLPGNSAVVASYQPDRPSSTGTTQDTENGGEKVGEEDTAEDEDYDGDSGDERPRRPQPVPPGELPSLGSAKHAEGLCKRCCFFPKGRCLNGHDCEFCHYEHEKRKRKKKKKSKQKEGPEASGSDAEVSTPSGAMQQPSTGDSSCAPVGLPGMPLRPPPPAEPAPPSPVESGIYGGPFDSVMWNAPQIDASTLRSVAGLPPTAPPVLPPQGVPPPIEPPLVPQTAQARQSPELPVVPPPPTVQAPVPPAGAAGGETTTNFMNGFGAAIATAAFVLEGSSPNADRGTAPGAKNGIFGAYGEVKVPTYTPLSADGANMWAYAAAASGLQANGTVPPAAPPVHGRPPPR